jgi:two-component system, OmpR family, sensor kinase
VKIRHKISLWITGAGLITSLVFSLVTFLEMREQPYKVLDSELGATVGALVSLLDQNQKPHDMVQTKIRSIFGNRYWIKVYDQNQHLVYQSDLATFADIPLHTEGDDGYTVRTHIPMDRIYLHQNRQDEIPFRVRTFNAFSAGVLYIIQIAKPMEKLDEELSELVLALGIGMAASTALLVILSYLTAGRIVKPISAINRVSKEISEKTLEKRIPLGNSHDELYELSSSLNRMFDRLQYSFKQQKQFLANASHELKSPAAMLRLFFDQAVQRQDLPKSFQEQLISQSTVVLRMERLLKTLLELSSLELQDSLEIEEFSLTDLLASVLEDFSVAMAAKNIQLQVNLPKDLRLLGDKDMIRRMAINILDNAIKYNFENGQIRLEADEEKDLVRIVLFNTGPGIPGHELEKVFEQFYRVEKSRSMQYGGSGLGLSIVRQIVRLHEGTADMESEPGAWSRIQIILPKHHR